MRVFVCFLTFSSLAVSKVSQAGHTSTVYRSDGPRVSFVNVFPPISESGARVVNEIPRSAAEAAGVFGDEAGLQQHHKYLLPHPVLGHRRRMYIVLT